MLSKLKYAGMSIVDLLNIYCIFIRSCAEYCSVVFHSNLSQELSRKLENIQRTSLKIILHDMYIGYEEACEMTGLETLFSCRQSRLETF